MLSPLAASPLAGAAMHPGVAARPGPRHPEPMPALPRPPAAPEASAAALWSSLLGEPPLHAAELQALAGLAEWQVAAQGQALLQRGQQAMHLSILGHGEAALGLRTADGTFRTERIVRGPAWLDQSAGWLFTPPALDAVAMGPVRLMVVPIDRLIRSLQAQPSLALRLIRSLAREVQALTVNTHELMHKDAPARLAQWLFQRLEPADEGSVQARVRLHDRKRDVASQLSITPETLSRLMRSFSQQGVIEVVGYTVNVLDVPSLGRLAQA